MHNRDPSECDAGEYALFHVSLFILVVTISFIRVSSCFTIKKKNKLAYATKCLADKPSTINNYRLATSDKTRLARSGKATVENGTRLERKQKATHLKK